MKAVTRAKRQVAQRRTVNARFTKNLHRMEGWWRAI
jgi:hypothetical protein